MSEKLPDEIVQAFKASDLDSSGKIHPKVLKNILKNWGEKLSARDLDKIFSEYWFWLRLGKKLGFLA
jgi:Ca2+-binding EF-hand superfamily protein